MKSLLKARDNACIPKGPELLWGMLVGKLCYWLLLLGRVAVWLRHVCISAWKALESIFSCIFSSVSDSLYNVSKNTKRHFNLLPQFSWPSCLALLSGHECQSVGSFMVCIWSDEREASWYCRISSNHQTWVYFSFSGPNIYANSSLSAS